MIIIIIVIIMMHYLCLAMAEKTTAAFSEDEAKKLQKGIQLLQSVLNSRNSPLPLSDEAGPSSTTSHSSCVSRS